MLLQCSIVTGRRYAHGDPHLVEIRDSIYAWVIGMVPELDVCPLLRFVPTFRRRMFALVDAHKKILALAQNEVRCHPRSDIRPVVHVWVVSTVVPEL